MLSGYSAAANDNVGAANAASTKSTRDFFKDVFMETRLEEMALKGQGNAWAVALH